MRTIPFLCNLKRLALAACLASLAAASVAAEPEPVRHSFFVAGAMTGLVGEDMQIIWDSGRGGARDGEVLADGSILICWADEIREFNPAREVVWNYKLDARNKELGTVHRLESGLTLVTELGPLPRLMEIARDGKVRVEVPLKPETDNAHMQTRMARKLPNGNYLVPHLLAFAVKEYTPAGEVVKTFTTRRVPELGPEGTENWPFTAIRLPDGNTLINLTHGNKTIEVDAEGTIVWKASNDDVAGQPFADPCGAQRLPNGNTVIASYGQQDPNKIKMFELTRDKKIVWSQTKFPAHHFQLLTTNSKPVQGPAMR